VSPVPVDARGPSDDAEAFVLELGRGLHTYGTPAHRLEESLQGAARRLGIPAQFFSMPTALFASFGPAGGHTFQVRVEPGSVQLAKLAALEDLARRVTRGEVSPAEGLLRLRTVTAMPSPYGPVLTAVAFAFASGAAARFFGGGLREVLTATVIGVLIGALAFLVDRWPALGRIFEPLAAAIGAFVASVAGHIAPVSAYVATASGLIVLIPGFAITVGITELATRNLVSGVARLAGAAGTFLVIGFGVALGGTLGSRLLGPAIAVTPVALPAWTQWVALLVAPLAFAVLLRADARDAGWIVGSGVLAFWAARGGAHLLGPELGAFAGTVTIGVASSVYARRLGRPDAVPLVPGILLLVPGSIGFQSVSWLLDRQTIPGVEAAFRMVLVAVALATGLLVSNVILPAERPPDGNA
jgi:uncharacterized membrane protein YjjP (DUF1212 family)